ncbi:hypothetical protein [Rhodopseudomonas sp. RCAM05734]|uniref:hypothetical protein n=1 Tax=Rhodopseudomonas sp. RCAM05734 TaxID=3457549 RepID=UPI0040447F40
MKKSLVTVLVLGIGAAGAAHAASSDDVAARLTALEKENATIRKENAALRQNKSLREQNATLKSSTAATPVVAAQPGAKRSDPFGAFAADLPLAYKARPVESAGQFRVWGEGGAIWSGGDRLASDYSLLDFSGLGVITGGVSVPGSFDLTPKLGWEAAAGFDYRFAASPWHVSGQFRYGEGKASGFASSAATLDAAQLAQLAQQLGGGACSWWRRQRQRQSIVRGDVQGNALAGRYCCRAGYSRRRRVRDAGEIRPAPGGIRGPDEHNAEDQ